MTAGRMFGLAILIAVPLGGIAGILHVTCDKLSDILEGIVLLMKYILEKEHIDDGNDIFRGKNN